MNRNKSQTLRKAQVDPGAIYLPGVVTVACSCEEALKPGFNSRILLVAGEIFFSQNQKKKPYPRFLHLISEIVKIDYHLPEQISIGVTNFCLNIFGQEGIRQRATKCVTENPA